MNLQAVCDYNLQFTYIDIKWPGSTSDNLACVTFDLCYDLDKNDATKNITRHDYH